MTRSLPDLSPDELARYGRHVILPEVGVDGQRRLKAARVLCVGAGGLGSPVAMYLAAAGVGTLGIVDFDTVDVSNLQRQILHGTSDVGRPKTESARARLTELNPHVALDLHQDTLSARNALGLIGRYDLVVDGTDNFATRYLVNDACVMLGVPNVYGAVFRFDGQASVFATKDGPCYRCVFPDPPPPGLVPSCAEAGVFGVLPGVIGAIQATEAIKLILGLGTTLAGRLLTYDALQMTVQQLRIPKNPECPVCGVSPTIRELSDGVGVCGGPHPGAGPAPPEDGLPFHITPSELAARWARGDRPLLLDVREPFEYDIVHLPDAELLPLGELAAHHDGLDPAAEIIVYCHHGIRSMNAAAYLRSVGVARARNLRGGIDAWRQQIDPTLPRY